MDLDPFFTNAGDRRFLDSQDLPFPEEETLKEPPLDPFTVAGLLDDPSDASSIESNYLPMDLASSMECADPYMSYPVLNDLFSPNPIENEVMTTLSPFSLSLRSHHGSIDAEAVCMGRFPSFHLFPSAERSKESSLELPLEILPVRKPIDSQIGHEGAASSPKRHSRNPPY